MRSYWQERECRLEECLGEDCPSRALGRMGEHVDVSFSPLDGTSHEVFHFEGTTIVVRHRRERVDEYVELEAEAKKDKPPPRRRVFSYHHCVTHVTACGAQEDRIIEELSRKARSELFPSPDRVKAIIRKKVEEDLRRQLEHVERFPHVYGDPERKKKELQEEFKAKLEKALQFVDEKGEEICRVASEGVE